MNAAEALNDLKMPPSNRHHALEKDRNGQHAIWINDQYRVCFRWTERLAAGEIGISGDTAIRLGRLFGTTPQFWLNLQKHYQLEKAAAAIGDAADRIVPLAPAA